jgi:hypothetical protein
MVFMPLPFVPTVFRLSPRIGRGMAGWIRSAQPCLQEQNPYQPSVTAGVGALTPYLRKTWGQGKIKADVLCELPSASHPAILTAFAKNPKVEARKPRQIRITKTET